MKVENLILVASCVCFNIMQCLAQSEKNNLPEAKSIAEKIDISHELDKRLEKWRENGLSQILICPQVISPDGDPFVSPETKMKLSVSGFGRLDEKDANTLILSIDKKSLRVPRLTGGFYAELYFLSKNSPFSPLDKLTCYISRDSVDIKFSVDRGRSVWVGLSENCSKLINSNFVRESIVE